MSKKVVVLKWDNGRRMYSKPTEEAKVSIVAIDGKRLYKADDYDVLDYVDPCDGGCWFCYTKSEDMSLDTKLREYDTYVHKSCLVEELVRNPDNPEVKIMAYLLEEGN